MNQTFRSAGDLIKLVTKHALAAANYTMTTTQATPSQTQHSNLMNVTEHVSTQSTVATTMAPVSTSSLSSHVTELSNVTAAVANFTSTTVKTTVIPVIKVVTSTATSVIDNITESMTNHTMDGDEEHFVKNPNTMMIAFLATIGLVALIAGLIFAVIRKNNLEKLRHHLMPVYNFDPSEEDGDDWETELLDEHLNGNKPFGTLRTSAEPNANVKFDAGIAAGLRIDPHNLKSPGSPTTTTGLLGAGGPDNVAGRQLYTAERNPLV